MSFGKQQSLLSRPRSIKHRTQFNIINNEHLTYFTPGHCHTTNNWYQLTWHQPEDLWRSMFMGSFIGNGRIETDAVLDKWMYKCQIDGTNVSFHVCTCMPWKLQQNIRHFGMHFSKTFLFCALNTLFIDIYMCRHDTLCWFVGVNETIWFYKFGHDDIRCFMGI